MSLTLSQLRVFVAVAQRGSVRAASRALGLAQSGVTQQLQNLEAELGGALLTRTNRGVTLTVLGQRLLVRAASILGECERASEEAQQLRGDYAGEVAFGLTTDPLMDALVPVLGQYSKRFPRVALRLRTGTSRMMISWIREGTLDFALALVSDQTDTTDLSVTELYPSDPVVVCRLDHPKAGARTLRSLTHCDWLATRSPNIADAFASSRLTTFFTDHGLPPPRIVATVEGLFETLHWVSETDCLALESSVVATRGPFAERLARIRIAERPAAQQVCLLQRAAVPLTPAAQELATMLASYARAGRAPR
ncbi:LysR substrate-binding domain-containing protein [Paraburkholderia sp. CNPSo 3076]|uniref:LysR family transcriptional regulator n=1 Tax=Paraburkholderia sp. CNPSo 3076 TaxID=2940936 RepID=UPI0022584598|nr:LysR substrate-binding domain-containing protein [Paraburkholderia sp. CNPSo 3076]MCX5540869.1 LysR substrate-binding domain-containing protein [Paraburkholderia sp. CNPSo 3076]